MLKTKMYSAIKKITNTLLIALLSLANLTLLSATFFFVYSWFFYENGFMHIPYRYLGVLTIFVLLFRQDYLLLVKNKKQLVFYNLLGIVYNSIILFGAFIVQCFLKF